MAARKKSAARSTPKKADPKKAAEDKKAVDDKAAMEKAEADKAKANAVSIYAVVEPLRHDGQRYMPGETVELSGNNAKTLLAGGIIAKIAD